jgi:surface protein
MSAIDTLNKLVSVKNAIRTAIKSKFSSDPGTDFSAYASKIKSKDNLANLFNGQATSPPISKSYTGKPTSLYRMYASTSGPSTDVSNLDTSQCENMSCMFYKCTSLVSVGDLSNWNTSNVTNMGYMFANCQSLVSVGDLSNWNTSNVTNMASMFDTCKSLTSIGDLSNWDTSKVTNMTSMFYNCQSLASVGDLSNWNTSKVTTMPYMFFKYGGTELNLANWDTSKVTDMNSVIYNCVNCTSVDVSGWDLSSCTNITYIYDWMFKLTNLILGEGWGKSPSSLTLGLNHIASKLTDESWTSFKSMYDRASNDLPTMTIKFSTNQKTNYTDWSNFVDYMTNKGYTITVV